MDVFVLRQAYFYNNNNNNNYTKNNAKMKVQGQSSMAPPTPTWPKQVGKLFFYTSKKKKSPKTFQLFMLS